MTQIQRPTQVQSALAIQETRRRQSQNWSDARQSAIPDLPSALVGHDVGLLIQEDHVLVFGGTSGGTSDQGYDSRTCIAFTLGSQHWVAFNHTMGRPRILTLSKTVGNPKRYLTFKTRMKVGSLSPCQVRWIMSAFRQNLFLKFCVFE